jgi:hypothetical protein
MKDFTTKIGVAVLMVLWFGFLAFVGWGLWALFPSHLPHAAAGLIGAVIIALAIVANIQ